MTPRTRSAPLRHSGMTLLERVVAMAVASLIALLGASALSSAVSAHGRGSRQTQAREDMRSVERMARHEWSARGQQVSSNGEWIEFDTLYPVAMNTAESPLVARVRYACEPSRTDCGGYDLRHEISIVPVSAPQRPSSQPQLLESTVIARQLHACGFSLLSEELDPQGRPVTRWVRSWKPTNAPPSLMGMALSGKGNLPKFVFSVKSAPYP